MVWKYKWGGKIMFKVRDKGPIPKFRDDLKIKTVYGILEDSSGYPKFLFYEFGQWIYHSAKNYEPYEMEITP